MTSSCRAWVRDLRSTLAVAVLLVAAVGCAGRGKVSGKVTYQDKNLVFGTVQFEASDGSLHYGNIDTDGKYTIADDMPTGEAKVAVSSINPKSSDFIPRQREGAKPPPPRPEIKGWFPIPEKYDKSFTSELTYPVHRGENTFNIELK
jgi:hypothetical protein